MTGRWAVLAFLAAGCGRVGFESLGDVGNPSFDLDFTRGERDGVFVQRTSPASYFDASGVLRLAAADEPRFDHDPITGEPLGLLIEGARTNRAIDSEALESDTEWFTNGSGSVVPDMALAPDGTMTADEV